VLSAAPKTMDRNAYRLRPFADDDYSALSRVRGRTQPELPSTPEEERDWDRFSSTAHLTRERWVVEMRSSSEVVAVAELGESPYSHEPHKFWVNVMVDPDHSHRGIGRALVHLLEGEAAEHRAVGYWSNVRASDPRARKFSENAGFAVLRTTWMSELDVLSPAPSVIEDRAAELELEGIRLTTLAAEGYQRREVRERLLDLWNEASLDVPRMGKFTPVSFEVLSVELDEPYQIPEAFFLACSGDQYVASSHLQREPARPDSLIVGFTGTRRSFRGRGIATELKRRSLEYARQKGYRYLRTFNDSLNPSIWAINEKMGFHRSLEISQLERRFSPPPTPGPLTVVR